MAGRPTKVYTIEDIEAKLEPWALSYLYAPEEEARQRFLLSEREKILTNESALYDTAFSHMDQQDYMSMLVNIIVHGPSSIYLKDLPEPVKEKLLALEGRPTPRLLRKPIAFLQEHLDKDEGQLLPKAMKSIMQGELYRDKIIAKDKLKQIYSATKFINLFYKWALTPPTNGRPNFYSCYTKDAYPNEIKAAFPIILIKDCDAVIDQYNSKELKKQEDLFAFIKNMVLKVPDYIKAKANQSTRNIKVWPFYEEPANLKIELGILDEIAQALEAVTLEDVTTRPSTRKELPLFTGNFEEVINGIHSPSVNAIATLLESDKRKEFNGQIYYTNDFCNLVLRSDGIEKLNKVPNHKIMRATLSIGFSKHGKNFFKSGEIVLPKDEFLFRMGLAPEQSKDPAYRRAFCRDLNKQLQELLHFTLEVKNDIAIAGGHIIDYCNTIGNTVTIRMGKECLNILVKHKKIAYVPSTVYANRIPDNKRLEYFLLVYLEDIYTNKYIQAREQDTLKVSTILENLNNYGVVDTENPHYKRKVIDRFIEALDYLQNVNNSIEYYFTTSQDSNAQAIEGPELEKYKSKANFSKLYLWFSCKPLEEYRNEEEAKKIMAEKALRKEESKKRQERARDRKLGELEAERIDKAREKAEAEAKAQNEQPKPKTLTDYFKQGNQ